MIGIIQNKKEHMDGESLKMHWANQLKTDLQRLFKTSFIATGMQLFLGDKDSEYGNTADVYFIWLKYFF